MSSFFFFDSQGSTRVLTTILGAISDAYSYMVFGVGLQSGSGTLNDLRYIGKYGYKRERPNVNLARRRILFSAEGRFDRRDLIINHRNQLYVYVENNPVMLLDPSGLAIQVTAADLDEWRVGFSFNAQGSIGDPFDQKVCCGAFNAYWWFRVDSSPLPCSGRAFFVQLVSIAGGLEYCDRPGNHIPADFAYLELWTDSTGSGVPDNRGFAFNDTFTIDGGYPNSVGNVSMNGEVRYFCAADILGGGGTIRTIFPGGLCTKFSRGLPCLGLPGGKLPPPWWNNDRSGGPGHHDASSDWDCCCASPSSQWSLTEAHPGGPDQTDPPCP